MSELIDSPLVRVPLESLKRAAKDRKSYVDEVSEEMQNVVRTQGLSKADRLVQMEDLVAKFQGLKRKLADVSKTEHDNAMRVKHRLDHLTTLASTSKENAISWNKQRLDRIFVDYLLRESHHTTALKLAHASKSTDLVDIHIFVDAKKVTDALQNHDCSEALTWCFENRARLKKAKSKLEFQLRVQEYIELVRAGQKLDAIAYAKKHLSPWAAAYLDEFVHAVAAVAFSPDTTCSKYAPLFDNSRWMQLIDLFHKDLYRLHSLTPESLLAVHLQAGLSVLKTPFSFSSGCSKEDPLHLPAFQALAEGLPYAKHVSSKLVCAVTRQVMNHANPPIVLPNGYAYSQAAVDLITAQHGGRMVCPRTGAEFAVEDLRRAFVA